MPTPAFDYGIEPSVEDLPGYKTDAQIDLWHDGALDALRGKPRASNDPDYSAGFDHGLETRGTRVQMPSRPEGYYHMPLGTFD